MWREIDHGRRYVIDSSGIALIVMWFACGLLAEVAVFQALRSRVDQWPNAYPGYAKYHAMVEDQAAGKTPSLPYESGVIKEQDFWRPYSLLNSASMDIASCSCRLYRQSIRMRH